MKKPEIIYNGCYDNQTDEQKSKNYKQSDVVTAVAPPVFPTKEPKNFLRYPIRSQGVSGRCVVFTYAKELSIWFYQKYGVWVDFSTCFPYQLRSNPDIPGCNSVDIYQVFPKIGNIFEQFMPGDGLNNQDAMAVPMPPYAKDLAKMIEIKRISVPLDFDTVASTLQNTGKGVMLWFHYNQYEWKDIPIISEQPMTSGHSIIALEPVTYNGQEYLVCDESWGIGHSMNGQRLISREYFNHRCYLASYLMAFRFSVGEQSDKPHFDGSIISAQQCFKWLGYFPTNIAEVENWGPVSRSSCKKFQKAYAIFPQEGNFGDLTKGKLYELFP
jgi:hypothetical protein